MTDSGQPVRCGWVVKKPTSQAFRSWSKAALQRRFIESRGFRVEYFAHNPAYAKGAKQKARGFFDLRDVSMLRHSLDPTAPASAVEVQVESSRARLHPPLDYPSRSHVMTAARWCDLWSVTCKCSLRGCR